MVRLHCSWCLMCELAQPSKVVGLFETCTSHCQLLTARLAACALFTHPFNQKSSVESCTDSPPYLFPVLSCCPPPPPPPSLPLTCSYTHPNLITSSTDQGASCACRDSMASQPISDAWHSPASDRQCRQDSTALLWRGQTVGLPAGDLPSSMDRSWLMTYIKLQCCQVVCLKRACPEGSLLLHDFIDVLLCLDKQPCSSAIDCTKHMTADPLFSAGQQQAVSVYT